MTFRTLMEILHFIFIILSLFSNSLFIYIVIFKRNFNIYSRFCLGCVSLSMIDISLTSGISSLENLYNTANIPIFKTITRRQLWLTIRSYGEIMLVIVEFISTCEKIISISFINFYNSLLFTICFVFYFLIAQILAYFYIYYFRFANNIPIYLVIFFLVNLQELSNLVLLILLYKNSKKSYFKTRGKIELQHRYQLSEAYRWCYSLMPSSIFSAVCKLSIFLSSWLIVLFFTNSPYASNLFFSLEMSLAAYLMIYPWTILLYDHKFKAEIMMLFDFRPRKVSDVNTCQIRSINGMIINPTIDQNTYFQQLKSVWA